MIGKWLRRRLRWPPSGQVSFGALRRLTPVGHCLPGSLGALDRYLADEFLICNVSDISGRVLEEGDGGFAARHGGARVTTCAQFDVGEVWPEVPREQAGFDCIILPGALHRIFALRTVLSDLHGRLRPGGVMLATLPGATQRTVGASCWRFTPYSARLMFAQVFGEHAVTLATRGNVMIALAHAHRLSTSEVGPEALRVDDPAFPFMIGVRAVRQADA